MLGFETDFQASGARGSKTSTAPILGTDCAGGVPGGPCTSPEPLSGVAVTSDEAKIEWFGTVRGRVGYLFNDGLLLYGTGGLAYGQVNVSGNVNVSAASPVPNSFGPTTSAFDHSKTAIGFATGAGLEGRLTYWLSPNWTWKLEYLYVDLGLIDTSTSFSAASTPIDRLTGSATTHTHFTDHIVRVGLNYQFH